MPRILILDDEPLVVQMLKRFLDRNGYEVGFAPDGIAGLALQRAVPADLVLTDILMPGKEGFETIRELRKLSPGVKIIAMSGGGRNQPDNYLSFAMTFGADRAFAKPLDLAALLNAISELLGGPGQTAGASPRLNPSGA